MKKIVKYGVLLSACALTLSSCNCYKKMAKNAETINVVANPEVLTLKGTNVITDVTVVFPEKYYNPKAIVKITPMLVFDGGVIEGAPKYLQGEKVKDNYPVIYKNTGGIYTQTISVPWDPRARECVLELKVEAKCDGKDTDFQLVTVIPVAEGVNTLQQDLDYAYAMIIMPDDFKRVTQDNEYVDIMYQKNMSNVRKGELSKEQTKLFEDFVKENQSKDRVTLGNIQAKGYASPEGPVGFNDQLSRKRGESGQAAISEEMKSVSGLNYDVAAYGEDWEGFKKLVENSNMKDKNLILQVLNMYSSSAQRDTEIRNMSKVFEELEKNILPQLRRTQMLATIDIQGKTDAELRAAASDLNSLDIEEALFAATLFDDPNEKIRIYRHAAEKYNDARAWNNLGIAYAEAGEWNRAERAFEEATKLSSNPALANNLALTALANGDAAKAARYLPTSSNGAKALASVHEGNYAQASSNLQGYNKAVADVLNGNLTAAKNALTGNNSADADYLRAVIAAKEADNPNALAYAKQAISKDPSLRAKALTDVNLRSIRQSL